MLLAVANQTIGMSANRSIKGLEPSEYVISRIKEYNSLNYETNKDYKSPFLEY